MKPKESISKMRNSIDRPMLAPEPERPWLEGKNWASRVDQVPMAYEYFDFHLLPEIRSMARQGWEKVEMTIMALRTKHVLLTIWSKRWLEESSQVWSQSTRREFGRLKFYPI
jgi:hypothetical protein